MLHLTRSAAGERVALTLDACSGRTDNRILSALVDNQIPATIFITARWLKRNGKALAILNAHPELFELENHGARHVPAIDAVMRVYGIKAAGSSAAVEAEVEGGATALTDAGEPTPIWFRGATAKYDETALTQIRKLGFKIAGYSINADGGSLLGAATTEKRLESGQGWRRHHRPHQPAVASGGPGPGQGTARTEGEGRHLRPPRRCRRHHRERRLNRE